MDLTQLANLGEFIGGIAVIASLIYVGFQVRQNTQGLKEASNRETSVQNDRILDFLLADKEARTLWATATEHKPTNYLDNPAGLDEDGLVYWWLFMYRVFNGFHSTYHTWKAGAVDDVHWDKQEAIISFHLGSRMGRDFWRATREGWWDAAFSQHIDKLEARATGE